MPVLSDATWIEPRTAGQNAQAMPRPPAPVAPAAPPATLGDRLAAARRARFVGREAERERFARMLAGQGEPVWFLHGPGGIGKSTLLRELAREADARQRIVIEIDARHVGATPAGWRKALGAALQDDGAAPLPPPGSVLLVDTFEAIAAIELWLRDEELPRYPADVLVVLAGRAPADPQWRLDAGWSDVAAVTTLAPWSAEEARDYLAMRLPGRPVPEDLLLQGGGYPLLLSLLADALRHGRGAVLPSLPDREALVRELLARFARELSDPSLRAAFDVLTIARSVAVPMLAEVVDASTAADLYRWLQGLPFVEQGEHGLQMHDFVRESFAASWVARDPVEIERLRTRVMQHLLRRLPLLAAAEVDRHLRDWFFTLRHTPSGRFVDHRHHDSHYLDVLDPPRDTAVIEAMVERRLGAQTLAVVRHWLGHAPQAFMVLRRRDGGVDGVVLYLDLAPLPDAVRRADPLADSAWRHVQACRAPQPGAPVWLARLTLDAHTDQLPNACTTLAAMWRTRRLLLEPGTEWGLYVHHNPDEMAQLYATTTRFNWVHRVPELDQVVDGRLHGVFVRDLVSEPVPAEWRAPLPGPSTPRLDKDGFAAAVRDALRHFARDDRLAASLLRRCRAFAVAGGEATLAELREALAAAVQALAAHPADRKFHHALRLTWLDPGSTQERVAEELGLPFNTYRYHLARGTERVVEALWQRELQAVPEPPGAADPGRAS